MMDTWIETFFKLMLPLLCLLCLASVFAIIIMIILAICSVIGPQEGTVIEKWYEEPTTTQTTLIAGKVIIPQSNYDDEDYMVRVRQGNRQNIIEIEREVWELIEVGDLYCVRQCEESH